MKKTTNISLLNKNIFISISFCLNYRLFSSTSVLKGEDDLMARLEKLLKINRDLVNDSKSDLLIKKRLDMHKDFEVQTNNMAKYLETIGNDMNSGERKQWEGINQDALRMFGLIKEKIDNLNTNDTGHHKKISILLDLHMNNIVKQQDDMASIAHKAVERNMSENNVNPFIKGLFDTQRTEILRERNKVLEAHKTLKEEEKDFFSKMEKESSLIDDFANPNLEQPSYMDPED